MFGPRFISVAGCLALAISFPGTAQQIARKSRLQTPFGVDLKSQPIADLAASGSTLVVLFFLATDCPVSNRYLPEIQRLRAEFAPQGVSLWEVYPNANEIAATVQEHERNYSGTLPVLLDASQQTTTLTGAKLTPEAAILAVDHGHLRTLYLGRIDNRFVSIGVERPRATRHDLEDAIQAAIEHRPIKPSAGPAVGCGIVKAK